MENCESLYDLYIITIDIGKYIFVCYTEKNNDVENTVPKRTLL